jgi:hypothetical protein
MSGLYGDHSISFQLMQPKVTQFLEILRQNPAIYRDELGSRF